MNIAILGASGRTGQSLLEQALKSGHVVTAVVRTPEKLTLAHKNLHIVKGDAKDVQVLTTAFKGQDAILSTLGISMKNKDYQLMQDSTKAISTAASANNVQRVIIMSTFVAVPGQLKPVFRQLTKTMMGKIIADVQEAEKHLKATDLQWTVVYAVGLTDKPMTGTARVVPTHEKVGLSHKITRSDVADFMLQQLQDSQFVNKAVVLAGK